MRIVEELRVAVQDQLKLNQKQRDSACARHRETVTE